MRTVRRAATVALVVSFVASLGCSGSSSPAPADPVATGTEREGNDALSAANDLATLAREGWIAARIDLPGDADFYRLVVPPGPEQVLVASVLDAGREGCLGIDTVAELFDAAGVRVASDDDDGPGLCARLARALAPGTWYLRVAAFSPADAFPYALHVATGVAGIEREPNDSPADALSFPALAPAGILRGTVDRPGDVDTYVLELPAGGVARGQLFDKSGGGCGPVAPSLALEGPPGHVLASTPGCGAVAAVVEPGTFYAMVRADATPVEYGLSLTARPFDEREPNGNTAEANAWAVVAIPAGGGVARTALGRITPGDADLYRVVVPAGPAAQLLASTDGIDGAGAATCGVDAVLDLLDGDGALVASSHRVGPGAGCSSLARLLPAGTFYLRVGGGTPALSFAYVITASAAPVEVTEVEPNEALGQASAVQAWGGDLGVIAPLADVDTWRVTAGPRSYVQAFTYDASPGGGCHVDTSVEILDAAGAVLAQVDEPGYWSTCANASVWTEPGGTFHVRVRAGAAATEPFAYRLDTYAWQPIPAEAEPNGTIGTASQLPEPHQFPSGLVSPAGDVDYWGVVVAAGPSATLWADTQDGTFGCTLADTVLTLVDAAGAVLASADDAPEGRCARLTALLDPGAYALRVSAGAGVATFPYDLFTRVVPFTSTEVEPNGTQVQATALADHAPGGVAVGSISPAGDVDVWRFVVTVPGVVVITPRSTDGQQTGACTAIAPRVRVLDAGGVERAVSDPASSCGDLWVYTLEAGVFDVEISSSDPVARWAYSLGVTVY